MWFYWRHTDIYLTVTWLHLQYREILALSKSSPSKASHWFYCLVETVHVRLLCSVGTYGVLFFPHVWGADTSVYEVWYWNRLHTLSSGGTEAVCVPLLPDGKPRVLAQRLTAPSVGEHQKCCSSVVMPVCVCVCAFYTLPINKSAASQHQKNMCMKYLWKYVISDPA